MKNIKTMKVFGSAMLIFGCFIAVLILGVYFFSEDKGEVEKITAQHIIYQSIGELGGFSNGEGEVAKTINILSDNIDNPDIEEIVTCYTNSNTANNAIVFRDYLKALNFSMGQFCKVQQNLEVTSTSIQNNNDRCTAPKSIIMSAHELEKLGRQYTGHFSTDLANCKN